ISKDPVVQYSENEPEAALEEELSALDKIGEWDTARQPDEVIAEEPEEVTYDFPIVVNKQVEFYLDLFQNKQRRYFEKWLARSAKYVPSIQKHLKEAGLPQDLAYLAMIESGYNPSAYSKSHAVGLWQFISSTGKEYGLSINSHIDERRDPEKATRSAIQYLSNLYREFDSWYLAVAAYNAGPGKIRRGIKQYETRDFWKLAGNKYLMLETKRYVPKLIAAIILAKDPEKYGFTDINYEEPVKYDVIKVPPMTDLQAVATAGNHDVQTLKSLNNELLKWYTPPGKKEYELKIPYGTQALVARNLSRLHPVVTTDYKTHVVKKGDTLTAICRQYNLNKTTLLKANNLQSARLIAGQRLRIPFQSTKYVLLKEGETPQSRFAKAGKGGQLFLHVVKQGETLSKISKLYNVTPEIIMQWNNLESVHKIRANQSLALYLDQPVLAGTTIASYNNSASANNEPEITYYRVKNGDSLWAIARKFRVSAQKLKQWNNLKSNLIHPGKELVVKKA
ncbi:MAG: LysM peptidoglycan-binding domain-containing protein, partial [Desulfobulbaceae bacterium]|nr:LysM peptidoglycan-binding domain-containing protein [Desulfobulbaceae bacterium]